MARYFKLAPLVFLLCACLLLLVVGCAKPPAERLKEGDQLLVSDPSKSLEAAQSVIDEVGSQPAGPERDKLLLEARMLKIAALGYQSTEKAMAEFESLTKDSPNQVTGSVVWEIALKLQEGADHGQATAIYLLDAGIKRFPDTAEKFKSLIEAIKRNPNAGAQDAMNKLGYLGGAKKEAPKKPGDPAKPDDPAKPKE